MEDVEILKRLAEIEKIGRNARDFEVHEWGCCWYDAEGSYRSWSPLTNWSDLGPLIEKYEVRISNDEEGIWDVNVPRRYGSYPGASNQSLPHAICLAIIQANGGMGDE